MRIKSTTYSWKGGRNFSTERMSAHHVTCCLAKVPSSNQNGCQIRGLVLNSLVYCNGSLDSICKTKENVLKVTDLGMDSASMVMQFI